MKKIEEVSKEFSEKSVWACPISFKAGVEFAQRWISVEDELPFGYVTLKSISSFGQVVYVSVDFSGANEVDTKWMAIEYYKATHWRPIELK